MCKSNLQGSNYFKIVKEAKIGMKSSSHSWVYRALPVIIAKHEEIY